MSMERDCSISAMVGTTSSEEPSGAINNPNGGSGVGEAVGSGVLGAGGAVASTGFKVAVGVAVPEGLPPHPLRRVPRNTRVNVAGRL
jgi:hypothetical protein